MKYLSTLLLALNVVACSAATDDSESSPTEPDPAENCTAEFEVFGCTTPDMASGSQYCILQEDGQFGMTDCVVPETNTGTPLVVSLDAKPVSFTKATGYFELFGLGTRVESAWVSASTPWLALDRNGNGIIDDGTELFGSLTVLSNGTRAQQGFEALAELDDDGDGYITERDSAFQQILLWSDQDQDRASTQQELTSLSDSGIVGIELSYHDDARCSNAGCERERARIFRETEQGSMVGDVVDVHLNGQSNPIKPSLAASH